MAKLTDKMLKAMSQVKKSLGGGLWISNKNFTKDTLRLAPLPEDLHEICGPIAIEVISGFSDTCGKKGFTSPNCFGLRDPVRDHLQSWSREEKDNNKKIINYNKEFYALTLQRSDPGDAMKPLWRIIKLRVNPYIQIMNMAEETKTDITDFEEGKDFVYAKTVEPNTTRWEVKAFLDSSAVGQATPDSEIDQEFHEAAVAAAKAFDIRKHIPSPDWEKIKEVYLAITGNDIPDEYTEQEGWGTTLEFGSNKPLSEGEVDEEEGGPVAVADAGEGEGVGETAGEGNTTSEEESGVVFGESTCEVEVEGKLLNLVIVGEGVDENEKPCWVVDFKGQEAQVEKETAVVTNPEPEPEPEPEAKPVKLGAAKGPVKLGGKPATTPAKTTTTAKTTATKPATTATKPVQKTATNKTPVKPTTPVKTGTKAPATAPKSSVAKALSGRLQAMKAKKK
jgi:hypothetical protein